MKIGKEIKSDYHTCLFNDEIFLLESRDLGKDGLIQVSLFSNEDILIQENVYSLKLFKGHTFYSSISDRIQLTVKIKFFIYLKIYLLFDGKEYEMQKIEQDKALTILSNFKIGPFNVLSKEEKNNARIFPKFYNTTWKLLNKVPTKTIFNSNETPLLLLTYEYVIEEKRQPLSIEDLKSMNFDKVNSEALIDLNSLKYEMELVKILNEQIVTISGYEFSSEKILDQSFLQKIQSTLGCEEIFVSIPRRTCFMAIGKHSSPESIEVFCALHLKAWEEELYNNDKLINGLISVKDGKIIDLMHFE